MLAITLANLKMMARNRQGLFWALIFPLLLVVVFGLFDFRGVTPTGLAVADFSGGPKADLLRERLNGIALLETEDLAPSDAEELGEARRRLTDGDLGYLLLIPQGLDDPAAESSAGAVEPVTGRWSTPPATRSATSSSRASSTAWSSNCAPTAVRCCRSIWSRRKSSQRQRWTTSTPCCWGCWGWAL